MSSFRLQPPKSILRKVGSLLLCAFCAGIASRSEALTIDAIFDSTITSDANAATIEDTINTAIRTYETLFLDPIHISITFKEMNTGLGSSSTSYQANTYTEFLSKLTADKSTTDDTTAVANLPAGPNSPINNIANMKLTTANARALGLFVAPQVGSDSTISLNTSVTNISRSGAQDSNKYDLFAVVSHEIDEALGTGSALVNGSNGNPAPTDAIRPVDLFRYGTAAGARSFTTDPLAAAYLSIDGTTHLVQFNQTSDGTNNGDFGDYFSLAAHTARVQDAYGTKGIQLNLGVPEKTTLDVIGYNPLVTVTWDPNAAITPNPSDNSGTWTAGGSSTFYNGATNVPWSNANSDNAQFGSAATASATPFTVLLGSPITVGTLSLANQNYTVNGGANVLTIKNGILALSDSTINASVVLSGNNSWQTVGTTTLTVSGGISGPFSLTKDGPGTLVLSNANSYSAGTTINEGTLKLGQSGALPTASNLVIAGGNLDLAGTSPVIGNLTFGNGLSTIAASIIDSAATKGTLTLNNDITYAWTSNGGFNGYFPAATIAANVQLASGTHHLATADTNISANYDLVLSGNFSGSGGLTKDGANYVALTGQNSYTGGTIINSGFFFAAATNTLPSTGTVTVNSPSVLSLSPSNPGVTAGNYSQNIGSLAGNGQINLGSATLAAGADGSSTEFSGFLLSTTGGGLTKRGLGTLTLSNTSVYNGPTTIEAGILQLGNGSANGGLSTGSTVSGSAGAALAFNFGGNQAFGNSISGSLDVTQKGSGIVFITADNTYTGTTTVSAGKQLYVGNGTTTGSLGTGPVVDSGTIVFSRSNSQIFVNAISGSGSLGQNDVGTLTLTGDSSYLGATALYQGTLQLGNGGTTGSIAGTNGVSGNSGTFLSFNHSNTLTFGGVVGAGANGLGVTQAGSGTTIMTAASAYFGPTTVNAGTLRVTGSIGTSATTVNNGGTLGGSGSVAALSVTAGGAVAPGNAAPGLLSSGAFSLASGGHLALELGGTTGTNTAATSYDELKVSGTVTLGGDVSVSLVNGFTPAPGNVFYVLLNDQSDAINNTFSNPAVANVITSGGWTYSVSYTANGDNGITGNDVSLTAIAPVPEPTVCSLLLGGMALLATSRRRRRAA